MSTSILVLCMLLIEDPDDQKKFQLLYNDYKDDMLRAAYSVLKDYSLAEDAVQEGLIRVARVIKSVDMSINPRAFMITVAKNAARDMVAKQDREVCSFDTYSTYYEFSGKKMYKRIENKELAERVAQYIMTLDYKYIEVFYMRCHRKMQYKDMAKAVNIPEATLIKRMQRLRELIAEYLEKEE